MARAYLRIWTKPGTEVQVGDELRQVAGITACDVTTGEQDIIAVVEAETYEDILQIIVGRMRLISGIEKTITNLAVNTR